MSKDETTNNASEEQPNLFSPASTPENVEGVPVASVRETVTPVGGTGIPSALGRLSSQMGARKDNLSVKGKRRKPLSWGLVVGVVGLLVLLYGVYWVIFPATPAEVEIASRQTITSAVYGTVKVEPKTEAVLRNQNQGTILKILVSKGDLVKENQVLAELSDPNLELNQQKAEDDLKAAKARFDIGPADKAAYEGAKKEAATLKPLADAGDIPQSEYLKAKTAEKTLADQVQNEQLLLDADVRKAEQALQQVQTTSQQNNIQASQDGIVLDIYAQVGELASPREQLFLLASKETIIRAQVNEEDVGMLRVGMNATVKLNSNRGEEFPAQVTQILPKGENMEYEVLLDLIKRPVNLLPGMTGEVNIITGKKDGALVIPSTALFNGNRVFTIRHGRIHEVPVSVGFRNIAWTEVTEGLNEGDYVVVDKLESFQEGQRVQPHVNKALLPK